MGKETVYDYDANTNVLKSVKYPEDTDATKTTYTYDSMYRVASAAATTDTGLAMSASYTYNNDLLTKIQTPSTTYDFTYGSFGLRNAVKAGDQNLATYTYADRTNYLTRLDYGNGDSVQYTYDTKGRVTGQTYEDGDTVTYKYDNNGALATVEDSASGIKTTYYYDFTDRMTYYVESGEGYSHSVGYEYDNINNLTSQVETINGVERTTSYTYDADNRVKTAQTGNTKVTYTYDGFGRVTQQVTTNGTATVLTETYTYNGNSAQVATYATTAGGTTTTYTYTYDDNGNITSINDGTYTTTYHYDSANQLIREDSEVGSYTNVFSYDNAGNILSRMECEYSDNDYLCDNNTIEYTYSNGAWGDLLESYASMYGNYIVTYDEIGNQLTVAEDNELYNSLLMTREYTWRNGRQLGSVCVEGEQWSNTYNIDGLRTERTNGTTTYNYIYNGSQLTGMTVDGHTLYFSYDAAGTPMSVNYDGTEYFYITNLQGDVVGIVDGSGNTVVTYAYTAWGELQWAPGTVDETLKEINPLRYRGYVYDVETNLYYLQSRYYDPYLCRFINADKFIATGQGVIGFNMFAYCNNNPIMTIDPAGSFPWGIVLIIAGIAAVGAVIGAFSDVKLWEMPKKNQQKESVQFKTTDDRNTSSDNESSGYENKNQTSAMKESTDALTAGERATNALIGAGVGAAVGGLFVATYGAAGVVIAGSATTVLAFGATGAQTFALGAVAYDIAAILLSAFLGIQMEPIEYAP